MERVRTFVETLQVTLVGEKILSFLTVEEMKLLSQVSWDVMDVIRKSDEFSNRMELHLSMEALGRGDRNGLLRKGSFSGKHMLLELISDIPDVLMEGALGSLLENVESLRIYLDLGLDAANAFQLLGSVLGRTRKLKALELIGTIVGINEELEPYFAPDIEVNEGHLNAHWYDRTGQRDELDGAYCVPSEEDSEIMLLQQEMLQQLGNLKLKQFSFRKQRKYSNPELIHSIPAILEASKGTLDVLELHTQVCCLAGMGTLELPKLKRLRLLEDVRVKPIQRNGVKAFISRQPALEELNINLSAQLCCGILRAMSDVDKLNKLKILRLTAKGCVLESDYHDLPMGWELLGRMTLLKEFSLSTVMLGGEIWYGNGEAILKYLPSTAEIINFEGIGDIWGPGEGNLNPWNDSPSMLISRFRYLRELNLYHGVRDGVTDDVLQSLIVHCPKLQSLSFGRCSGVTRYGLSGIRRDDQGMDVKTGASLDQLSGLLHLSIGACIFLYPKDVLQAVKLLGSLKTFQYSSINNLSKKFLFDIVRSIPSLEQLTLGPFARRDEPNRVKAEVPPYLRKLKEKAKAINPRLAVLELEEERLRNVF